MTGSGDRRPAPPVGRCMQPGGDPAAVHVGRTVIGPVEFIGIRGDLDVRSTYPTLWHRRFRAHASRGRRGPHRVEHMGDVDGPPISQQVTLSDPSTTDQHRPVPRSGDSPSMLPNGQSSASINSYFFIQITDITPGSPAWGDQVDRQRQPPGWLRDRTARHKHRQDGRLRRGSGTSASLFLEGIDRCRCSPCISPTCSTTPTRASPTAARSSGESRT